MYYTFEMKSCSRGSEVMVGLRSRWYKQNIKQTFIWPLMESGSGWAGRCCIKSHSFIKLTEVQQAREGHWEEKQWFQKRFQYSNKGVGKGSYAKATAAAVKHVFSFALLPTPDFVQIQDCVEALQILQWGLHEDIHFFVIYEGITLCRVSLEWRTKVLYISNMSILIVITWNYNF